MQAVERGESPAKPVSPAPVAETLVVDALGNAHGPDGKFVAKPGDPEQSGAPAPAEPEATPATTVPEGFVSIEVQPDHPLHHRLGDKVNVPKELEEVVRWNLNNVVRKAEVEAKDTELQQTRQQLLRLQAEQEIRSKMFAGPEYTQAMAKIDAVRSVDPEAAALMERGLEREIAEKTEGRFEEIQREQWGTQLVEMGNRTQETAERMARARYSEWFDTANGQAAWTKAVNLYTTEIRESLKPGELPAFNPQRILEIADFYALKDPWMVSHLTQRMQAEQQATAERIRQEAEAKALAERTAAEKAALDEQLRNRRNNPLGRLATGLSTGQTVPAERAPTSREYIQAVLR